MIRRVASCLVIAAVTVAAAPPTPEAALARVVRTPWTTEPRPTQDEVAEARGVLEAARTREPDAVRWLYGLAHVARLEGDLAQGEAAEKKRKESKEAFEAVVARAGSVADHHFWLGNACFEMIDDVGMLSKASLASQGRKAFERAIAIDPGHVAARVSLAMFYIRAPAIAGGSAAKARDQGEALLKIPEGRGEFQGRILLGRLAADAKDWAEMTRQYTAAETAKGDGARPAAALASHASALLMQKKEPAAALTIAERYAKVAAPDDVSPWFLTGESLRQLGRCKEAVDAFEKVLAKNPEARNSRFGAAECYAKIGRPADAKRHYEEFVRRFPKDDRASQAREAIKKPG